MMSKIKKNLEKNGYVIIKDILNKDEIDLYKDEFFKWKKSIDNIDELHKKINPHYIFKYHQIGHQRHAWLIRINKKIQNIFKELWDCNDLVVSFDGCCYMPRYLKSKDNYWTHTDQSKKKKGLHCYQSFVALTSNKEKTLVVYKGSHKLHEKYFEEMKITENKDWNVIDENYINKIQDKKRILKVPAGSLVIWDSRTFHQNQYGNKNTEERLVQYLSYLPKNNRLNTPSMQNKRQKYFDEKRTTSHWAYPIHVNSLQPRNYGNDSLKIDYNDLPEIKLDDIQEEINKLL